MTRLADQFYMHQCLALAAQAEAREEVPVGALCVFEGRVVGVGSNTREADQNPVGHAELDALRMAAKTLGTWRLSGVTLYVTLEPCPMCAGALVLSRVERVVYATDDPKAGAVDSLYSIGQDQRLNHVFDVTAGVLKEDAAKQLSGFFKARRKKKKPRTRSC
jgi:tRNA(adenine34) deaminase